MFLNSLHLFRAIAIVFIVAGHCYWVAEVPIDSFFERMIANLITGGTALFVFISGFLFHHIFIPKFRYSSFMMGKVRTVLIPYLLLSIWPILTLVVKQDLGFQGRFLPQGEGIWHQYLLPYTHYLWTGSFITAYWYVPFILVTFAMSPLHRYFASWSIPYQLWAILCLVIISLLIHRPVDNLSVFQSVIYYLPIYLFGLVCSQQKEHLWRWFSGREWWLLGMALILAAWQAGSYTLWFGNFHKSAFSITVIDLNFLQKLCLCLFFMIWLHRFETKRSRFLDLLAHSSFAIFLLHPFVLGLFYRLNTTIGLPNGWLSFMGIVSAIIAICIGIGYLLKRLFGDKSRYLTGW